MKRVLCGVVLMAACVAAGVWLVWPERPRPAPEPARVHFSDLPAVVYHHGRHRGGVVVVSYPLRLHPSPDPLVWYFKPGSDTLPPTHRLHFAEPPDFPARPPFCVTGTVEGIDPDGQVRTNNVPGVVVLTGCRVVPPASP
jgi:hypothetical protein